MIYKVLLLALLFPIGYYIFNRVQIVIANARVKASKNNKKAHNIEKKVWKPNK